MGVVSQGSPQGWGLPDGVGGLLSRGGPWYAVLDAARHSQIHPRIVMSGRTGTCLHESSCAPDVEEVGAHLIALEAGDSLSRWILEQAPGKHWGIFVRSEVEEGQLFEHLRSQLLAQLPDGSRVWLRYYDPRVLLVLLPSCTPEEVVALFGPIQEIVVAGETAVTRLWHEQGVLVSRPWVAPTPEGAPALA